MGIYTKRKKSGAPAKFALADRCFVTHCTEYKHRPAHIVPTTTHGFSHPGLISFKPTFDIDISISADNASFSGDATVHFRSGTDPSVNKGFIRETYPFGAGGERGGLKSYQVDKSFDGHLNVRHGEVQLSITPRFNMEIDVDESVTGSLSKRNGSDLVRRDSLIDSFGHTIQYVAGFSGMNRLTWDEKGMIQEVDALVESLISRGDSHIADWESSETIGAAIGSQPGAVRLHQQGSSESRKAPGFARKVTPYTIFKADVLTCTKDEDGTPLCVPHDFCKDGSLVCNEQSVASRPKAETSRRRSLHMHQHQQHSGHHKVRLKASPLSNDIAHQEAVEDRSNVLQARDPLDAGDSGSQRGPYKSFCYNPCSECEQRCTLIMTALLFFFLSVRTVRYIY
jgi:hypothetical protein